MAAAGRSCRGLESKSIDVATMWDSDFENILGADFYLCLFGAIGAVLRTENSENPRVAPKDGQRDQERNEFLEARVYNIYYIDTDGSYGGCTLRCTVRDIFEATKYFQRVYGELELMKKKQKQHGLYVGYCDF